MSSWKPHGLDVDKIEEDSYEIAKKIMMLHNENLFPETGTVAFIMGTSIALGNMGSIYTSGLPRNARKEFESICIGLARNSFKFPFIEPTTNHEGTVQ